jgi:phosphinothricin acetyltransferase
MTNNVGDGFSIEAMRAEDWPAVRDIYLEGLATGQASFETETPTWDQWNNARLPACRLVARDSGGIVGWAALSPVSSRHVYRGVAEASVYIAERARGQGVGRALLEALIKAAEAAGIWTLEAKIFPENAASLALCEKCGFRRVGVREKLGCHKRVWRDVLLLERRSATAGTD